jgi:hypothetical protein
LTPAADSRISVDEIQHGKQLLEGLPCLLRFHVRSDFDAAQLHKLARGSRDPDQTRPLALAEVYAGGSRSDAARIGGVSLQIVRDWVLGFNAEGPDGLLNGKAPGVPSILDEDQRRALRQIVEDGLLPAVHGVVRWRLIDQAQ